MNLLVDILFQNLLPIFLIIGAGYAYGRAFQPDIRTLSRLSFFVLSPCLVYVSLLKGQDDGLPLAGILAFSILSILASGLLGFLAAVILRLPSEERTATLLSTMFVNGGNYGLAVTLLAFGEKAMAQASIYFAVSSLSANTIGVLLASSGKMAWHEALVGLVRVPAVYAVLLAGLTLQTGITLPAPIDRSITLIGAASIPAMLILLGVQLSRHQPIEKPKLVGLIAGIRLVGGIVIGILLVSLLGLQGVTRQAMITQSAMPVAVINTILAVEYNVSPPLVASAVVVSTLLSPFTLTPLLAWLK